jgi:hypothetical protein
MALSLPVAPHPASRRRSYIQLQAGVGIPGEDLHLPDQLHSQAHDPGFRRGRLVWGIGCQGAMVVLVAAEPAGWIDGLQLLEVEFDDRLELLRQP